MKSFICFGKPPSANKRTGTAQRFLERLKEACRVAPGGELEGHLYGIVYWFIAGYNTHIHPDADNISKPVWDALKGLAFEDDKQIRLRLAGVIDLAPGSASVMPTIDRIVDLTNLPSELTGAVARLLLIGDEAVEDGFCYVEIGSLATSRLSFEIAWHPEKTR